MGLFINNGKHPDVFKHRGEIDEPNQGYLKIDYFSEMVNQQMKINENLAISIQELGELYQKQSKTQAKQWNELSGQLHELKESDLKHEKFQAQAREWINTLNNDNLELQKMMENEQKVNQKVMEQLNIINESNHEIVNQLDSYKAANQLIQSDIHDLVELNKQMTEQMVKQDENQNRVINQLDNQEALLEKTFRQINNLRSILFEQANHLADKIENSYNLTSSYFYKLLTGSDQPLTLVMMKQKQKKSENQKTAD
ncbi:hypothetical protein SAMN05877753_110153 [Bacillus oleivorans]|uniref:Uncharacterized protein n=1 Tax=Bacillus oleivorans TaxID=1448271 RepID=A0A285D535_9BACI|nr:hypothetical protein [Bacillus oleivorans]SNX74912.1 hypothetical protein SAMN05877753_110153 [Bacillus oleivorans]